MTNTKTTTREEIKISRNLKARILRLVQQVNSLTRVPSMQVLKKLFPEADLRKAESWLSILDVITVPKIEEETKGEIMEEINYNEIIDSAVFNLTRTGQISRSNIDTLMGYSFDIAEREFSGGRHYLGTVGYKPGLGLFYKSTKNANCIFVTDINLALQKILKKGNRDTKSIATKLGLLEG